MSCRPMRKEDLPRVAAIAKESKDAWSIEAFATSLEESHTLLLVQENEEEIVTGFGVMVLALEEGELVTIAVASEYRRQGKGAALLSALLQAGETRGMQEAYLEVRSGNEEARRLYLRTGFEETGIRKAFYGNPKEDAILMKWRAQC